MGVVYAAFDEERRERVALKTLKRMSAESLVRFKREYRALQGLHHPNLVTLGDLVSEGEEWFFSMELVGGTGFLEYVRCAAPPRVDLDAKTETMSFSELLMLASVPPPSGTRSSRLAGTFDEARLRHAMVQLAEALAALHQAGKVHRDVKPSNIRVTGEGRLVLLDFGLVTDLTTEDSTDLNVVGTPSYMAPEQAASKPVGPEADCYAMGALLYQALTGRVPFEGAPLAVLMEKQTADPPRPSACAVAIPADLDALCVKLLQCDPSKRPTARDVSAALDAIPRLSAPPELHPSTSGGPLFVGRTRELAALDDALRKVETDAGDAERAVSVLVTGDSGIGKSSLVAAFARSVDARGGVLVLRGRCYEREAVPFKAFDGLVDAIGAYLARASDEEAAALVPHHAPALARIFPVLRRVRAFAAPETQANVDPRELRRRGFAALRELLGRLADRKPLVVWIDDLQWADADSLALLRELTRPPDAPGLLLVATARGDEGAYAAHVQGELRVIRLERLDAEDARELTTRLLERHHVTSDAPSIAGEAQGHPLFIDELVRHIALVGDACPRDLRLEDALSARVHGLGAAARDLVEVVAVAGRPLPQETIARAMGIDLGEFSRLTGQLRVANLIRTAGARAKDGVEAFHDRVREGVLGRLAPLARRAIHERLALALEAARDVDPEALFEHWMGAGNRENGAKYAIAAAELAERGLAFDRAARLYAEALAAIPEGDARRRAVRVNLADALANAGRGDLAAGELEEAALGAPPNEALDLRRRAAEQLFRSGKIDRAFDAVRVVLAAVGLKLPRSPFTAFAALLFWKTVLAVRGLGFRERDPAEIPPGVLTRIDVCWSVMFGLSFVDPLLGALFQARHMLLALRAGDPARVGRAIAGEAGHEGVQGSRRWKRTQMLVDRAGTLTARVGTTYALGLADFCAGLALDGNGRPTAALERLTRAEATLGECNGTSYEIALLQYFILYDLTLLGRYRDMRARHAEYVVQAEARGDAYLTLTLHIGHANSIWLMADDPARARVEADRAMRDWPVKDFHIEHMNHLFAIVQADLYEGDAERAAARLRDTWPRLGRSMLFLLENVKIMALEIRARTAVAAAATGATGARGQAAHLRRARADSRRLARVGRACGTAHALLLDAGIANVRGDRARAVALLRDAVPACREAELHAMAHVARRALGALLGGEEGARLVADADDYFASEQVKDPARFCAVLAPGLAP